MSETVTALKGASFAGIVSVADGGPRGMIAVRGDMTSTALRNAATGVAGVDFPDAGFANCVGERAICWMSPDELLVLVPHGEAASAARTMEKTLDGTHHLVANVSDARAVIRLEGEGPAIRETLAKLSPADMAPAAMPVLRMRRTRLAQVPGAILFHEETFAEVFCFRSVAEYVFGLLTHAARPGSEVGHFR